MSHHAAPSRHSGAAPFHPAAWFLWGAVTAAALLMTQNPLYLALLLLALVAVRAALRAGPLPIPVRFLALMPLLGAVANGLTIHIGERVVARLPQQWPLIGGPITLEAIASGAVTGFGLVVLLVLFATLGAGTRRAAARRLVPGVLFQAGLVTTIALSFAPQTLRALTEIREAQQIRGKAFRGWRDLPPLFLPLLTMGLERSISLAEAMESRGFGAAPAARRPAGHSRFVLLVGLLVVVAGVGLTLLSTQRGLGWATVLVGVAIAGAALRQMNRRVHRTRYREQPWLRRDIALAATSLGLLVALLLIAWLTPLALRYYPFPRLTPPPFDLLIAVGIAAFALPAMVAPTQRP